MKTEHFKVFLEKHAECHYKAGIHDCIESLGNSLAQAKSEYDKAKASMHAAAKECGIEAE